MTARAERTDRAAAAGVLAVAAVLVVVTLGGSLLGATVFHGGDIVERFQPWSTLPPDIAVDNPLVGDTVDVALPNRRVYVDRLRHGDLPLWQPYANGGRPLAAIPDQGLLSPLNWPYLVLPVRYAPAVVKLLEVAVALAGTAALLGGLGVRRGPALLAGLAFAFSGFQIVYTNFPLSQIAALLPVCLWATDRWLRTRRASSLVVLAGAVASAWLLGFPQVTAYLMLVTAAWTLTRGGAVRHIGAQARTLAPVAVAAVAGTALAAFQLVPWALDLSRLDLGYRAAQRTGSLDLVSFLTVAAPDALGRVTPLPWTYFGPANPIEIQSWVGVPILALAALGAAATRRRSEPRRLRVLLIALAVVPLLLTWWDGPLMRAFQSIPLLGLSQVHRIRVVAGLALALLAGIGLDRLFDGGLRRAEVGRAAAALVALAVPIALAAQDAGALARAVSLGELLAHELVVTGAVLVVTLAAIAVAAADRRRAGGVAIVLAAVFAGQAAHVALPFWPRVEPEYHYPVTPAHEVLERELGSDRLASTELTLYPGTTTWYGIRVVAGHAFPVPSWRAAIERLDPGAYERESATFARLLADQTLAASPLLDRLAARMLSAPQSAVFGTVTAPAASADTVAVASQPVPVRAPAGPLRGVVFEVRSHPAGPTDLHVEVRDSSGRVLARGQRRLQADAPDGPVTVGLPEVARDDGATVWVRADGAPVVVTAVATEAVVGTVRPDDDGLTLVHAGGVLLYRRDHALPRIRWAAQSVVQTDEAARLDLLASDALPDDTVVLSSPDGAAGGGSADLEVTEDGGDVVTVVVTADGPGHLVVADSMQVGWRARVDGQAAALTHADQVGVAVAIPAGRHVVRFTYEPAGWTAGRTISVVGLLALVAMTFGLRRRRDTEDA